MIDIKKKLEEEYPVYNKKYRFFRKKDLCKVPIGLVDFGFNSGHPDFHSMEIFFNKETANPVSDHGIVSASILAGMGKDKIEGVAAGSPLYVANIAGENGLSNSKLITEGLSWLQKKNVKIIAIPFASKKIHKPISKMIGNITKSNVLIFSSAGNFYPEKVFFPASHSDVISVAAADYENKILPECNRDPCVDLIVPGLNIPALGNDSQIVFRSGTSIACVIAAGLAAHLVYQKPELSKKANRNKLLNSLKGGY